ncbi:DUF4224 domain-containing protein [Stenotrophomonas sp. CFBP 13725]|uniref:DUF4224 domain-containing protein n=1 Tax=Stenotrophomonas sp. CFBP 13725 TaxID=2775297 RepID=UPI001784C8C9|nr:DUF4224 domain-containing protein [Stenotrophomonas sp. CFBP 13725]MBD8635427.1 DUF4224 domain-containing protein [Stenotrophomonas sp. CFBP 13725]
MAGETLSRDEVEELCRTPMRVRQLAFFERNGIRYRIDEYSNRIIVLRQPVGAPVRPDSPRPIWRSNKAVV